MQNAPLFHVLLDHLESIDASPAEVYAAWTDLTLMRKWFGTIVEADVRVGGRWRIENHEADGRVFKHKGEFMVLEPPHRLVISFQFDGMSWRL